MSTVETTEALDALPPEVAVYPGTDADDQHVYIRDTTEGCWVAYVRADCVGVEEIPLPAYVPSQTAADQPTTEASAPWADEPTTWIEDDHFPDKVKVCQGTRASSSAIRIPRDAVPLLIEQLTAHAPAPQPAADTETEVQWGVRVDATGVVVPFTTQERAAQALRALPFGVLVTRTVTSWEEA